jgi:predicted Fe-S protein YdhL (DUF1289 family)
MDTSGTQKSARPRAAPPTPAQMLRARAALVMRQAREPDWPVPSPCCAVCSMDEARGYCAGCLRTIGEIAAWSRLDNSAKLGVWRQIKERIA